MITAQTNPASQLYVLVYDGNSVIQKANSKSLLVPPRSGTAKAKIASIKKYISNVKKLPVDKFIFVEAGFRENPLVEFWLVPPGAISLKLTPTLTKMKYRKGKAKGYCLSCCEN